MCSDGLDSWFASLPLFGEVSEKNWERLDLDYDMEVGCQKTAQQKPLEDIYIYIRIYIYIFWCLRNLGVKNVFFLKQITNTPPTFDNPPASETCQAVFHGG